VWSNPQNVEFGAGSRRSSTLCGHTTQTVEPDCRIAPDLDVLRAPASRHPETDLSSMPPFNDADARTTARGSS
jgi:hypothetical protein